MGRFSEVILPNSCSPHLPDLAEENRRQTRRTEEPRPELLIGTWAQPLAQESRSPASLHSQLPAPHTPPTWMTSPLNTDTHPPARHKSCSLTLMDFLLVAELGRVLLFNWEELELFSSSSSSSSSKLMLLEMPGPGRGARRDEWSQRHTQTHAHRHQVIRTCMHTCTEPSVHTCIHTHSHTYIQIYTRTLRCMLELVTMLAVHAPSPSFSSVPPSEPLFSGSLSAHLLCSEA